MYCKECQKPFVAGTTFCKHCGAAQSKHENEHQINEPVENEHQINKSAESTKSSVKNTEMTSTEQSKMVKSHNIFHNGSEALIDSLGSGFINSIVAGRALEKSVMFLSDKRVYQKGKVLGKDTLGRLVYYNGEKSVDLREITGIGFLIGSGTYRLKPTLILSFLGGFGLVFSSTLRGSEQDFLAKMSIVLLALAFFSLFWYKAKKVKYLVIEFAGGSISTRCDWYSRKSIIRFMKNISTQKDKIFS